MNLADELMRTKAPQPTVAGKIVSNGGEAPARPNRIVRRPGATDTQFVRETCVAIKHGFTSQDVAELTGVPIKAVSQYLFVFEKRGFLRVVGSFRPSARYGRAFKIYDWRQE